MVRMKENECKEIDKEKLSLFYRLILKVPGADFLQGTSSGVFWAIIVPVFVVLEFFLSMYLLLFFQFPLNVVLTAIVPVGLLLVFMRISLERFVNWWNLTFGEVLEWNVEKSMQEYLVLIEEKKKKES